MRIFTLADPPDEGDGDDEKSPGQPAAEYEGAVGQPESPDAGRAAAIGQPSLPPGQVRGRVLSQPSGHDVFHPPKLKALLP